METPRKPRVFPIVYGLAFLVAGALSVVMLMTDKNLQTDFGTLHSGYFAHWYAVLGMALADFAGAGLLFALRSRLVIKLGVLGAAASAIALLAVVYTYQQVGFASSTQFADYLFGVTYYGGDIRYLYDVLVATYLATAIGGAVGLLLTRSSPSTGTPADSASPTVG